jgi:leucyl-tRNA synthetase
MQSARDWYREVTTPENGGTGMHADLVFHWLRMSALMVQPLIPHFSEYLWMDILEEKKSVQTALWPEAEVVEDKGVLARLEYMRGVLSTMRSAEAAIAKKKGKGKATGTFDPSKPRSGRIFVATSFPAWQREVVESIKQSFDASGGKSVDDKEVREALAKKGLAKDKRVMPFMQQFKVSLRSMTMTTSGNPEPSSTNSANFSPRDRLSLSGRFPSPRLTRSVYFYHISSPR